MARILVALAVFALGVAPVAAEDPKPKATVSLSGSLEDEVLKNEMPANGVIASQKEWEKLAKAWSIKDAPKVNSSKELLVVGTWRGSSFTITPVVKGGDLTIRAAGTKDLRPGFRWKVDSIAREGIKTVNGKALPNE